MYFNCFQSKQSIELFNPNNRDLISNWKFIGRHDKTYDNILGCSMYVLDSGGLSRMQLPAKRKAYLGLLQSYLVFQLYLFSPKQFSIEISISDTKNVKRRLLFSTHLREISSNYFSSLIPIIDLPLGTWINLSIDVLSFVCDCFKFLTFKSIDTISLSANCKVRKIFTMRNHLIEEYVNSEVLLQQQQHNDDNEAQENETLADEYEELKLPSSLDLPVKANAKYINLNISKVNAQLKLNQLIREEKKIIRNNNRSVVPSYKMYSFNNGHYNFLQVSPMKSKSNSKSPPLRIGNESNEKKRKYNSVQKNNFVFVTNLKTKKKTKNKKKKGNRKEISKESITTPTIKIQLFQKQSTNATEKRYQDNYNEELKNSMTIQHQQQQQLQSEIQKRKLAQLNNFLFNSKDSLQKQNTFDSKSIEEINVYESQISLGKKESGIIHIDDFIGKEYIKDQRKRDIANRESDIYQITQANKEDKKKLLNEMLNDNPLININTTSRDRPYSPPITKLNNEDNNDNEIKSEL